MSPPSTSVRRQCPSPTEHRGRCLNTGMDLDLDRVRKMFPALDQGVAYFDGPGGSQTPYQGAEAIAAALGAGLSNRGSVTAAERRADEIVLGARAAVADLVGCRPEGVVFGRSMTQLAYDL